MVDPVNKTTGASGVTRTGSSPSAQQAMVSEPAAVRAPARSATTITEMVDAGPPIDTAKIAALKAEIAAGRYVIEPDQLANDIISHGTGNSGR